MSKSTKEIIHVEIENDTFDLKGYLCELSANSFIPTKKQNENKQRNFYNYYKKVLNLFYLIKKIIFYLFKRNSRSIYDQIFDIETNFNPKAHRDDRQHSKFLGLNQNKEV